MGKSIYSYDFSDEDEEELEESFDSTGDENHRGSDWDKEEEEMEESFDFSGEEEPVVQMATEETDDDDEISTPLRSPPPPKRRKKRSRDRISASPESQSPMKRRKEGGRDIISILPDALLIHILSFLPTKDIVRTGILSKRWLYLWASVENISFKNRYSGYSTVDKRVNKFITFVDKALVLSTSSNIRKFSLDFAYERRFAPNVNLWVRFAMQKNVEELQLNLYNQCPDFRFQSEENIMGTSRDSDGFSDEEELEESFDSNEDKKPHGSTGTRTKTKTKTKKCWRKALILTKMRNPMAQRGTNTKTKKSWRKALILTKIRNPMAQRGTKTKKSSRKALI
ncbi:hypothetical protein F0562_018414 [Nyssa sinensis]|uniref:F-box domain-containing protein n=1 Tax=Nyssa sinensis TaxID=561372 RepID=A0A5J4ZCB9_9ASTE|nr:hypothetical protein F0562_018414 [Nyssa sinensis]